MTNYLVFENVRKVYNPKGQSSVEALRGVSLSVEQGEMLAITGVSGSGKSTLLHIMGFLDSVTDGEIFFKTPINKNTSDKELARLRNRDVGFVLQDFALIPYRTAFENIEIPMIFAKKRRSARKERIEELLVDLGIFDLKDRRVSQMSGGQKQRVAIARALANDPEILLADEPTGALDSVTKTEIIRILKKIHKDGKTVVIVTHDPEIAAMADRNLHIRDGRLV